MKRSLFGILTVVILLGMLLGACAPKATQLLPRWQQRNQLRPKPQ